MEMVRAELQSALLLPLVPEALYQCSPAQCFWGWSNAPCHAPLLDETCKSDSSIFPLVTEGSSCFGSLIISFSSRYCRTSSIGCPRGVSSTIITPTFMLCFLRLAWLLPSADLCLVAGLSVHGWEIWMPSLLCFWQRDSYQGNLELYSWRSKQCSVSCPIAWWYPQNWSIYFPMIVEGLAAFGSLSNPLDNMYSRTLSSDSSKGVKSRSLLQSLRFGSSCFLSFCWGLYWRGLSWLSQCFPIWPLHSPKLLSLVALIAASAGFGISYTDIAVFIHGESDRCLSFCGSFSATGFSLFRQYLNHHPFE